MSSLYILSFLYKHFIFALPCKEESMNINISQWIFYCTKLIALSAYMLSLQLLCLDRTSFLSAFEILKSILENKDASAGLHRIRKEMLRLLIKSQSKGKLCTGSKNCTILRKLEAVWTGHYAASEVWIVTYTQMLWHFYYTSLCSEEKSGTFFPLCFRLSSKGNPKAVLELQLQHCFHVGRR